MLEVELLEVGAAEEDWFQLDVSVVALALVLAAVEELDCAEE
jgi:hypothetical protein